MQYLCLIYIDERTFDGMSQRERDARVNAALDSDERLRRSGHHVYSQALQGVRTATTLTRRDGRLVVSDGPFAETKEQLGGFVLIEARDLDEAIALAGTIPMVEIGSIEIRPVQDLKRVGPE